MEKLKAFIKKYYEGFAYLFFGGLATLLNLVLFAVFQAVLGTGFATGIGNVLDNIICILFAYWTNRTFVFRSKNSGQAALAEFGQFVACRIGTMSWTRSSSGWASACWHRMWHLPQPTLTCGPWVLNCSARLS